MQTVSIYIITDLPGYYNKVLSFGFFFRDLELSGVGFEIQFNEILSAICVFIFTFGFVLSFFYIKRDGISFVRRSLNLISISFILIGGIGFVKNNEISLSYKEYQPTSVVLFLKEWDIHPVFYIIFLIIALLFVEYIILENTRLLTKDRIKTQYKNGWRYCRSCGVEIVDPKGEFCSKCGIKIK